MAQQTSETLLKILAKYMLSLVSKFSNDTLEYVKLVMQTDKSDFLHNKMRHVSMMEKYLKRFKDCMTDMEFIKQLIEESDPKLSHSIEKIYQLSVYDVFDDIERRVNDVTESTKRLDIQIEFFTTFVRSFLKQVYDQIQLSKPFYFHRLDHKEQRQRIDLILKPLLSQMVHPTANVGPVVLRSTSKPIVSTSTSKKISSTRIMHVESENKDEKKVEEAEDDDEEDDDEDDNESVASSAPSVASSMKSVKSVKKSTKEAEKKEIKEIKPIQSAVVLPEPIRSAKPIVAPTKTEEPKVESKEVIVNIVKPTETPKPENVVKVASVKPASTSAVKVASVKLQSSKKILTPMKMQSDTIHATQRQIQSVILSASNRMKEKEKNGVASVKIKSSIKA